MSFFVIHACENDKHVLHFVCVFETSRTLKRINISALILDYRLYTFDV